MSPTTVVARNDTRKPVELEVTFGPTQPFGIAHLGALAPASSSFGKCVCTCAEPSCPDYARPRTRRITVKPGESSSFRWNGKLMHYQRRASTGRTCCEYFVPPVGRYVVTACATDGRCARQTVTLPTTQPITVKMSAVSEAASCKAVNLVVAGHAARHFLDVHLARSKKVPAACRASKVRCVSAQGSAAPGKPLPAGTCTIVAIPRKHEIELRVHAAPDKAYSSFWNPDFTVLARVKY